MPCYNSPLEETANEVSFSHGFIQDHKYQQGWEESQKGGERLFTEYECAPGKLSQPQNLSLQKVYTMSL